MGIRASTVATLRPLVAGKCVVGYKGAMTEPAHG